MKEHKLCLKDLDFWLQSFVILGLFYFLYDLTILFLAIILTILGV